MDITTIDRERLGRLLNDAAETARNKYPDDDAARSMHQHIHAAIGVAGDLGRPRRMIAMALSIAPATLDTRLGAKQDRGLSASNIARVMLDRSVLGPVAHSWLSDQLVIAMDRKVLLPLDEQTLELDELPTQALELADASGFAASIVRRALDEESPGGARITPSEGLQISGAAASVMHEAGQMVVAGGAS